MGELASVKVTVSGRVTGIGFRAFVRAQALALGLTGYVRNLPGGKAVEVEAEGERASLETLIAYLRRGPPLARVERLEVDWVAYSRKYKSFSVRH